MAVQSLRSGWSGRTSAGPQTSARPEAARHCAQPEPGGESEDLVVAHARPTSRSRSTTSAETRRSGTGSVRRVGALEHAARARAMTERRRGALADAWSR